jgi:hypothetical protein
MNAVATKTEFTAEDLAQIAAYKERNVPSSTEIETDKWGNIQIAIVVLKRPPNCPFRFACIDDYGNNLDLLALQVGGNVNASDLKESNEDIERRYFRGSTYPLINGLREQFGVASPKKK